MKTKYYVNGKLVRTSENPDYKYAVIICENSAISFHTNKELAQKQLSKTINEYNKRIAGDRKWLKEHPNAIDTMKLIERRTKELNSLRIVKLEKGL